MSLDRIYSVKNPPPGASKKSGRRTIMLSGVFVNIVQSMTCDRLRRAGTPSHDNSAQHTDGRDTA
ncbi:hypothetical protein [Nostoc punctiforme]|uniref:hypothetical protein n=1 Tax=Nostoc punctiforme TaxID=272131 RepID=UPI0011D1045B|nr:hypothetical protein [Nostoc punctiforme]